MQNSIRIYKQGVHRRHLFEKDQEEYYASRLSKLQIDLMSPIDKAANKTYNFRIFKKMKTLSRRKEPET